MRHQNLRNEISKNYDVIETTNLQRGTKKQMNPPPCGENSILSKAEKRWISGPRLLR